jgi:hypothetical protein
VSPSSQLTSAASGSVHTLVGLPKVRGLWCNRARSCSPRAASNATRTRRTVSSSQPSWRAI